MVTLFTLAEVSTLLFVVVFALMLGAATVIVWLAWKMFNQRADFQTQLAIIKAQFQMELAEQDRKHRSEILQLETKFNQLSETWREFSMETVRQGGINVTQSGGALTVGRDLAGRDVK